MPPYGFRYRLARFFMGRNGPDTLYFICFALSFLMLSAATVLARLHYVPSVVCFLLSLLLLGYAIFRVLSRNLVKRQRENAAVRRVFGVLFRPFRRIYFRIRDRKTHVFRKCPHCHATLRLARVPGEHIVRCPACHERFSVKVRK